MKIRNMMAMASGTAAVFAAGLLMADTSTVNTPTPGPMQSQVQTHLRLDLKEDVKEVHFINTNNDPYVYTKIYILKNADPYELRPYLVGAIGGRWGSDNVYSSATAQGRRINDSSTRVECIKYMDGVGAMIVSAEDYRFRPDGNENGMSIDEMINILDQPNIASSSSHIFNLYFPKYNTATELETAIKRVGLNGGVPMDITGGDQWELANGKDSVRRDNYLNALLFYIPDYSVKNYQAMLVQYDKPNPEVLINYTVYEYDSEIDSQVGNDFQAWKNGPGTDLFAIGGRFTNGWDINSMNIARNNGISTNSAKYMNFNPKWNTKYLDLLATKSYAKVVTSGSLSLFNNKVGVVGSTVQYPTIKDGSAPSSTGITTVAIAPLITTAANPITISGLVNRNNTPAANITAAIGSTVTVYKYTYVTYTGNGAALTDYLYEICVTNGSATIHDELYMASTPNTSLTAITVAGTALQTATSTTFVTSTVEPTAFAIQHAPTRVSSIASLGSGATSYGFQLQIGTTYSALTPNNPVLTVCENTTTVPITMTNTNLIGFTSNGSPRTSVSQVSTVVVANNKGERFVIGGLEKEQVIRSASKLPYLGDIPGIGWIVGNERETHKKSQLVAIIDVVPVLPETGVAANVMGEIAKDKQFIGNYGVKNSVFDENDYGYDQFLLDSEKKSLDPLP